MDDELNFQLDQNIKESFEDSELILMSCSLSKYNKREKCQQRAILITSKAIYNINKFEFLANVITFFKSSYAVRRRINIEKVAAITVSESSDEFVIHVKDEEDLRYSSPQRDKVLASILKSYEMNVKKPLNFFYKEDSNLHEFMTTEDDVRNGIIRMPTENPIEMNEKEFQKRVEIQAVAEKEFLKDYTGVKVTLEDFDIWKVRNGRFSRTVFVEKKDTKQIYALKGLDKKDIYPDQMECFKCERYVMENSQSPFIIKMEFAFQTPEKVFLGTKFLRGGELFQHLRTSRRFDEKRAKFYAAEMILGLEHLHEMSVICRDLKPENILMDEEGHICLRDFEMSKRLELGQRTNSFVGTPEYISPEIIKGEGYGHSVDWWALGVMVFEMLFGRPPFYQRDQNTQRIFEDIRNKYPNFSQKVSVSEDVKDFILRLLQKDPEKRLGSQDGADEVKKHRWLADIDWDELAEKKVVPPYKPKLIDEKSFLDDSDFDDEWQTDFLPKLPKQTGMNFVEKHLEKYKDLTFRVFPPSQKAGYWEVIPEKPASSY